MWRSLRLAAMLVVPLLAVAGAANVRADGEAGLVIQDGSTVTTFCVAFEGDGIRGDQLLRAAGHSFDAYGGGGGLAVCSIDGRGCDDASSFSSCWCQCKGGDCTYWAFFTRDYGKNWVYSSLAFNLLQAGDGDVHGWKWGAGGPSSAPAPADVTFEQICGHAPRGGVEPPTPTSTPPPPTAASTSGPASSPAPTASETTAATEGATVAASPSPTPPLVTITNSVPSPTAVATPAVPDAGADDSDDDGAGSNAGLIVFGVVAAGLVALAGAGMVWRSRRGV